MRRIVSTRTRQGFIVTTPRARLAQRPGERRALQPAGLGELEQELDLPVARALPRAVRGEASEQLERVLVLGEHQRDEVGDALLAGALGEPLEQAGADAAVLPLVVDRDRGLRVGPLFVRTKRATPTIPVSGSIAASASWSWWSMSVRYSRSRSERSVSGEKKRR